MLGALALARPTASSSRPARIAMIAITTKSSINVNAPQRRAVTSDFIVPAKAYHAADNKAIPDRRFCNEGHGARRIGLDLFPQTRDVHAQVQVVRVVAKTPDLAQDLTLPA